MDGSRRPKGIGAFPNGPGTALILADSEKRDQTQEIIGSANQAIQSRFFESIVSQKHLNLVVWKVNQL
jgi:hypothetical protein